MATHRVRIVPPYRKEGDTALGAFFGLALGTTLGAGFSWFADETSPFSLWPLIGLFLAVVGIPLGVVVLSPVFSASERPITLVQPVFTVCYGLALSTAMSAVSHEDAGSSLIKLESAFYMPALYVALIAAVLLVIGMIWSLAVRAIVVRLKEQDGDHCWKCAYQLGSDQITRCPECGEPRSSTRFVHGWLYSIFGTMRTRAMPLLVGTVVVLSTALAYRLWDTTFPLLRLRELMDRSGAPPYYAPLRGDFQMGAGGVHAITGRFVLNPLSTSYSEDWAICYIPHGPDGTTMHIRTAYRDSFLSPTLFPSTPLVGCDLDPVQTGFVFEHGLPLPLLHAMAKKQRSMGEQGAQTYATLDPVPFLNEQAHGTDRR
ncbi:MAG TPA: hypothetical protein VG797_01970 [Phycisphaerales bacterium]|nr:hypothetical protein [Phycisphaerales bacterium]